MKLLKKLLPIATVASVVGVVTPLVTSCGNSYVIDGSSWYVPTIPQAVADEEHEAGYNTTAANLLYYKNIEQNPEILFQDLMASLSYSIYESLHKKNEDSNIECRIIGHYSNPSIDKDNSLVSYNFDGTLHLKNFPYSSIKLDIDLTLSFELVDYTSVITYDDYWLFGDPPGSSNDDSTIAITANGKILSSMGPAYTFNFDNETKTISLGTGEKLDKKWEMLCEFCINYMCVVDGSYHLANITHSNT